MRTPALLLCLTLLGACTGVKALDEPSDALSAEESALVSGQVERAREQGDWTAAWNQAVDMGGDRQVLEEIALSALEAQDGAAGPMLAALWAKWGGLGPEARGRVDALVARALEGAHPARAAEIEILAAEDVPRYAAAWRVYASAPVDEAPGILERIRAARKEHAGNGR